MKIAARDQNGKYIGSEKQYSKEDCLSSIHIASNLLNKTPTYEEYKMIFKDHGLPHPKTIQETLGSWSIAIKEANLVDNKEYSEEFLIKEIERFIEENNHIPSTNEFRYTKSYPGIKAYKRIFGSFNQALVSLGYTPVSVAKGNQYGNSVVAKDGHICDSNEECMVDNFLFDNKISHSIQPLYPRHSSLNIKGYIRADFLLQDGTFVEYCGLINKAFYRTRLERKIHLANELGLKLITVMPSDLSNLKKIFKTYIIECV